MAGYYQVGYDSQYGAPILSSSPISTPLYGNEKKLADSTGWTQSELGNYWTSGSHPGQYLQKNEVLALARKQQQAGTAINPNTYNPGVDYTAAVDPYLSTGTLNSLVSSGPGYVNDSNEYETRLRQLLNDPNSIADTGAYKFALDQGQQAIERSAAAKGMGGSGNTLAELLKYGQGMASQQYGQEADRLAALSGQQKNYILGQRGANVADFSARLNAANTGLGAGQLALKAAEDKSGDYWKGRQMAATAANDVGYWKGPQGQSIW